LEVPLGGPVDGAHAWEAERLRLSYMARRDFVRVECHQRKTAMKKKCDLELLARDPANFTVEVFNDWRHICVNDLVDVWPTTKRYMVRGVG
jgi:hypothetical protein